MIRFEQTYQQALWNSCLDNSNYCKPSPFHMSENKVESSGGEYKR